MRSRLIGAFVVMFALSACASPTPAPTDAPRPEAIPTTADTRYGAPTVTHGRALGPAAARPCDLLAADDLTALGLDPSSVRQRAYMQALNCRWSANGGGDPPTLTITTSPGRNMLVDAYRARVNPVFMPMSVSGLPAVTESVRPNDFVCFAEVAANNDEGVGAIWYAEQPLDPPTEACDNATKALAAVVAHLPPR